MTQEQIQEKAEAYAGTQIWINKNQLLKDHGHLFHEHISTESYIAGYNQALLDMQQRAQQAISEHIETERVAVRCNEDHYMINPMPSEEGC